MTSLRCPAVDFWESRKRAHIWLRSTVGGTSSATSTAGDERVVAEARAERDAGTLDGILSDLIRSLCMFVQFDSLRGGVVIVVAASKIAACGGKAGAVRF